MHQRALAGKLVKAVVKMAPHGATKRGKTERQTGKLVTCCVVENFRKEQFGLLYVTNAM